MLYQYFEYLLTSTEIFNYFCSLFIYSRADSMKFTYCEADFWSLRSCSSSSSSFSWKSVISYISRYTFRSLSSASSFSVLSKLSEFYFVLIFYFTSFNFLFASLASSFITSALIFKSLRSSLHFSTCIVSIYGYCGCILYSTCISMYFYVLALLSLLLIGLACILD